MLLRSARLRALGAHTIDVAVDGEAPPTEFRLFRAGENETTKGTFIFDAEAASAVMAAAAQRDGVDYPIDLEHLSLESTDSRSFDPDARGWFCLAVRNGELWAVNVRWTPDGQRRLSERTQRYVSPAFTVDDEDRVTEIVNVALVAMPATHGTPALVAANRRPRPMTLKDRRNNLAASIALTLATLGALAKTHRVKLADGESGDAPAGKFAAAKSAADAAAQALADFDSAATGSDIDATFAAMEAAVQAADAFKTAVAAIGGGGAAPEPEAMADKPEDPAAQQMARERAELITLRAEKARAEEDAKVAKLAAEMQERSALDGELVKMGRETPATVKLLAALSLADLRARVTAFRGSPSATTLGRVGHPGATVTAGDSLAEVSEYEAGRVTAYAEKLRRDFGDKARSADEVLKRYIAHKEQQVVGCKAGGMRAIRLGRPLEEGHVLLSRSGKLQTLATSPVRPIEEFGASSQRALEEFRMNYNMALAAEPMVWAEQIGDMLPGGALKETYPLNFAAARYVEKTAQGPGTARAKNVDISITKREFNAGEQVELRRLEAGDFAYALSWQRLAERMARARVTLRNTLVTALLEAGTSGFWGSSAELATGIDGQPFWSATHKVNPFDDSIKLRGSATWSNYQSSATTLGAVNLTAEKAASIQVAAADGTEIGFDYDQILLPSALKETAKNLLTIQDLILDARASLNSVNNVMGATRNPHYQSGMDWVCGPELAAHATPGSSNYYLIARTGLARGLVPWVIAEDSGEDLRTFDESSDFFKDSGEIKIVSHIYLNAALLYPHAIRYVKGS